MTVATAEMIRIAAETNIFKIMGTNRLRSVTLDVIPARGEVIVPRIDADDDSLTAPAPTVLSLRYDLEDQMFGGACFASLTCQGRIVVLPFPWISWEELATSTISVKNG